MKCNAEVKVNVLTVGCNKEHGHKGDHQGSAKTFVIRWR